MHMGVGGHVRGSAVGPAGVETSGTIITRQHLTCPILMPIV